MNANTKPVAAEPTAVARAKPRKGMRRPARPAGREAKLVCRYCGSDDLAPSFKKRRDARYLSPCEYEHFYRDQAQQITRSSTASRTAWPPQTIAAGALHGGAVSDSKPITLSGPPSDDMPGGAEKLVSDQCQDGTLGEAKPVN